MPRATWNGTVLAESPAMEVHEVEGNVYFPPDSVNQEYLRPNTSHTQCPWKGTASYYDIVVNGESNRGAAWFYPQPKDAASAIRDHVAFWRGVTVER